MKVATKRVDLAPHFNLNQLGRYAIIATVKIKAWNRELASSPKMFDIIHGAKLWNRILVCRRVNPLRFSGGA
jgi:hypothetical protein